MPRDAITWGLPQPFEIEFDVADDEIDRLGHVNNAVYLTWCERTGWAHTEALGLSWEAWGTLDAAMIVHRASLDYRLPAVLGDRVVGRTWLISNDQRIRSRRRFEMLRAHDLSPLFAAEMEFVCVRITDGRPRRMPPEFVSAYALLPEVAEALKSIDAAG